MSNTGDSEWWWGGGRANSPIPLRENSLFLFLIVFAYFKSLVNNKLHFVKLIRERNI